jgi:diaminopimelate epimerase
VEYIFKYQALGNDMLVIDPSKFSAPLTPALIRRLCNRHFGIGADGICYGPLPNADHQHAMRFFNPDGSEAEKSGNGLRIFARYLWDQKIAGGRGFEILIGGQNIGVMVMDDNAAKIALEMGRLSFTSSHIPAAGPMREVVAEPMIFAGREYSATAVSVGNPHCVIFSEADLADLARTIGPLIETAPQFLNRTNVQFARTLDRHTIEIEIWERGAGYTLASGTSACAAAGAAVKTGRCNSPVTVRMAGGVAEVAIDTDWRATLTGQVAAVFEGKLAAEMLETID